MPDNALHNTESQDSQPFTPLPTRDQPDWLIEEPWTDTTLGPLRSGKEAQIDVIERTGADGRSCLLAVKRYVPRKVSTKGALEAAGFDRASTFRHDVEYREGRQFRKSRDRRAVERMSTYGKRLLQDRWTGHEYDVTMKLWQGGLAVPYPISFGEDRYTLEFIGDRDQAAPQLAQARLNDEQLSVAADLIVEGLHVMTRIGFIHGDLSAYNLLWWRDQVWFIDLPQAIDLAANPQALNYLHRDVSNIVDWLNRRGHPIDAEELFAELVATAYG